jgi:hypothetical protein
MQEWKRRSIGTFKGPLVTRLGISRVYVIEVRNQKQRALGVKIHLEQPANCCYLLTTLWIEGSPTTDIKGREIPEARQLSFLPTRFYVEPYLADLVGILNSSWQKSWYPARLIQGYVYVPVLINGMQDTRTKIKA